MKHVPLMALNEGKVSDNSALGEEIMITVMITNQGAMMRTMDGLHGCVRDGPCHQGSLLEISRVCSSLTTTGHHLSKNSKNIV